MITKTSKHYLNCPAPAKINWFLHVVGREENHGYHLLQSAFQLIDLEDEIDFSYRGDGQIVRHGGLEIPDADDLCVRAAKLLQETYNCKAGADICVRKRIPVGAGLGGGSSDAATTLIALNKMWEIHASREDLMALALPLGADVPFFIFGQSGFGEKRGQVLQEIDIPTRPLLVVYPSQTVPTAQIFAQENLTRDTKTCKITDFTAVVESHDGFVIPDMERKVFKFWGRNDLEPVAATMYPVIAQAIDWLQQMTGLPARMSGSGSSVFSPIDEVNMAKLAEFKAKVTQQCPDANWQVAVVNTLSEHPMLAWLS